MIICDSSYASQHLTYFFARLNVTFLTFRLSLSTQERSQWGLRVEEMSSRANLFWSFSKTLLIWDIENHK